MVPLRRPIPAILGLAAATVALAAAVLVPAHLASASVRTSAASSAKPTVVIEAGAWLITPASPASYASCRRRYTVDVPPNPLQGLTYDSQTLAAS